MSNSMASFSDLSYVKCAGHSLNKLFYGHVLLSNLSHKDVLIVKCLSKQYFIVLYNEFLSEPCSEILHEVMCLQYFFVYSSRDCPNPRISFFAFSRYRFTTHVGPVNFPLPVALNAFQTPPVPKGLCLMLK